MCIRESVGAGARLEYRENQGYIPLVERRDGNSLVTLFELESSSVAGNIYDLPVPGVSCDAFSRRSKPQMWHSYTRKSLSGCE